MEKMRLAFRAVDAGVSEGVTRGVAILGAALILVAARHFASERLKAKRLQRHWARVCLHTLQERDSVEQKVLRNSGDAPQAQEERRAEDARITSLRGTELMAAMREGTLSCERAVVAFCRRANAIGKIKTKSVTQEFYDEAVRAAKLTDERRSRSEARESGGEGGRGGEGGEAAAAVDAAAGLLCGMPMSIKDAMHMKGALTTCGMACKAAMGPSREDGLLVKVLRAHGAIPFVRGNVGQCMMLPESDNAIFGRSDNPWDLGRTPGGSSGGEGSLVASRCTPLALGSDVGGSIRIPAHFTGTCGLKPTPERMSRKGMESLTKDGRRGQRIIQPTPGPIANSVKDLELAMTALCSREMWDGDMALPRVPWDREVALHGPGRPLKVGFFTTDHWFEPCAAITRAVHESAEGLRAAGHEVVPFEPPISGWQIAKMYYGQMGAEGNMKGFVDALQGETMLPGYASLRQIAGIPNFLRPLLSWVLRNVLGDERKASILGVIRNKGLSVRQYYELVADTFDLRSKWEEAMVAAGLDAVIFPPAALPALPHGTAKNLTPAFTYMFIANLLHWPAGVVPVTLVRPEEEDYNLEKLPANQRDVTAQFAREACRGSAGLPVGVQVMTTPFKEELALHVMREVERAVGFDAVPAI